MTTETLHPDHGVRTPDDISGLEQAFNRPPMQLHPYQLNEQGEMVPVPASPDIEEQIYDHYADMRAQLMEGLQSDLEGLDMERINSFMTSLGLESTAQILVLNDDDYELYEERYNALINTPVADRYGSFAPGVDIVAIHRNAEHEKEFGSGVTEYKIVHELAHSSAKNHHFLYMVTENESNDPDIQIRPLRSGQIYASPESLNEMKGSYLEEGFADNVAQRYVHDELHLDNGFGDNTSIFVETAEGILEIPSQVQRGGDGSKENVASIGLELLYRADSTLFESFIKARTDPQGLEEVAAKINAIGIAMDESELYEMLCACQPNIRAFCDTTMSLAWIIDSDLASGWQDETVTSKEALEAGDDTEISRMRALITEKRKGYSDGLYRLRKIRETRELTPDEESQYEELRRLENDAYNELEDLEE